MTLHNVIFGIFLVYSPLMLTAKSILRQNLTLFWPGLDRHEALVRAQTVHSYLFLIGLLIAISALVMAVNQLGMRDSGIERLILYFLAILSSGVAILCVLNFVLGGNFPTGMVG